MKKRSENNYNSRCPPRLICPESAKHRHRLYSVGFSAVQMNHQWSGDGAQWMGALDFCRRSERCPEKSGTNTITLMLVYLARTMRILFVVIIRWYYPLTQLYSTSHLTFKILCQYCIKGTLRRFFVYIMQRKSSCDADCWDEGKKNYQNQCIVAEVIDLQTSQPQQRTRRNVSFRISLSHWCQKSCFQPLDDSPRDGHCATLLASFANCLHIFIFKNRNSFCSQGSVKVLS